jgi:site-specific DNA-methyltransferase (adenine-specific)
MESLVSSRQPFGLSTTFHGRKTHKENDLVLYDNSGETYIGRDEVTKNNNVIDTWKVFISRAGSGSDAFPHPILGVPFVGAPGTVSSETYIFIGPFESEMICQNVVRYISTRFFRFLVMLKKVTQSTTKSVYTFVPQQDFSNPWTDEELYAKYNLTDEEIAFIESMIKPMEIGGDDDAH